MSGVGECGDEHCQERRDQGTPKGGQPGDEEAHVVPGRHKDGVNAIAGDAGEVITLEQAIGFDVADDWLDGVPSAKLASDCR